MNGDDIRKARKALHYSQETLAVAAGVSRKTIQNAEAGQPLSAETRRALLAVLSSGMQAGTSREDDKADEVERLIDAWVDPATPADRLNRTQRTVSLGTVAFLVSVLIAGILAVFMPDAPVIKWIALLPILPAMVAMAASIRLNGMRTESDVDNERAAFRERLKRDGLDAWRDMPKREEPKSGSYGTRHGSAQEGLV